MSFEGMDVEVISTTASNLDRMCEQLSTTTQQLSHQAAAAAQAWLGADASAFSSEWARHSQALRQCESDMRAFVRQLRANITQQTSASAAPGGSAQSFSSQVGGDQHHAIDLTLAKLAQDVESNDPKGSGDFKPVSDAQLRKLGLSPNSFHTSDGLDATLYEDPKTGQYVLAYAGSATDFGKDPDGVLADWVGDDAENALQLPTIQTTNAMLLAESVHDALGGNVVFTGHSLGGEQAAEAARVTGSSAVVFNASLAGTDNLLVADSLAGLAGVNSGSIRSYANYNDPVTDGALVLGHERYADQIVLWDSAISPLTAHNDSTVISAMEAEYGDK